MHVIFIAGWSDPFGDFTKEHAYALARFCKVSYIHVDFTKSWLYIPFRIHNKRWTVSHVKHYDARIFAPLRRFGIFENLVRRTYTTLIREAVRDSGEAHVLHINVRTPLTELIPGITITRHLPIVLSEHSSFYHHGIYRSYEGGDLDKEMERVRQWLSHPRIKMFTCVSSNLGNTLVQKFGVPENKLRIVPNVAAPEFRHQSLERKPGNLSIMLAGIWHYPKNPIVFVQALTMLDKELLSRISIEWIGIGEQLGEVRGFLQKLLPGLSCNFRGAITERNEMALLYNRADVFVHPSDAENLPCVIIESLCCGTPVISNTVGGVPELVDESNGLLSPPRDARALALNIENLCLNFKKYDRKKISDQALGKYAPEVIGKKLFEVYAALQ
jgi:glycosyltransferase involved in cell wall biosynthesis